MSILVRIGLTDLPKHGGEESSLRFLRFGGVGGHSIGLASKIVGIFFKSTYVSGIINQILRNVHKYAVQNIFHFNLPYLTRALTKKLHIGQLLQASKRLTVDRYFREYSFLNLTLCTVTFGNSTYRCGNYSREETIRGNTVTRF